MLNISNNNLAKVPVSAANPFVKRLPHVGINSTKDSVRILAADEWFALGERVQYDREANKILQHGDLANPQNTIKVFRRIVRPENLGVDATWVSFLPGWPDGSYGWSKVDQHLAGVDIGPRLFVEYIGQGDSDKPVDYSFGINERADLVEAHWRAAGTKSTFIIGFDYSAIVALELLSRQQNRQDNGLELDTVIKGVLFINGGLFAEAHSHPWFTTPILKSPLGGLVTPLAQRWKFMFAELMKPLWSKRFKVSPKEIDELYNAIGRRKGIVSMSKSAGIVDQHKQYSRRLDLARIFHASKNDVSFHVFGSEHDPFEGRQASMAKERLGDYGLDVRIYPGGHLATSEQPELLAEIIQEVVNTDKRK